MAHPILRASRRPLSIHSNISLRTSYVTKSSFSSTTRIMLSAQDLQISPGSDPSTILSQTTKLTQEGKWHLCANGKGLERGFQFKTFKATWDFMNQVAAECKKQKHHPEWSNVYNKTHIRWTTHQPEGLSDKDVGMAEFCDEVAREMGEVDVEGGEFKVGQDGIVEAGGCCTPGKRS